MDPLWSETFWSTYKNFIILIVSTYYILCISWKIKCLTTTVFMKTWRTCFGFSCNPLLGCILIQTSAQLFVYSTVIIHFIHISPITGPRCPEGSRQLRFPDYVTMVVRLSALHTGRFYPRKYSWYSFLLEADYIYMVYGIFNKLSYYFILFYSILCYLYALHTAALNYYKAFWCHT